MIGDGEPEPADAATGGSIGESGNGLLPAASC
jgi:hypothetical protein